MAPKSQVKLSVSRTIAFRCSSDSGNIAALELTVAKDHAQTLRYRIEALVPSNISTQSISNADATLNPCH